jgi:OHCU decarboxylase
MTRFRNDPPSGLNRDGFLARFGAVYEHSPWVAATVWDAGEASDDVAALAAAMARHVDSADETVKLSLLRAHPDLAGKLALDGELSPESAVEQAGAGLDRCSADELSAFHALNEQYLAKFHFPFIIAVRGLKRPQILEAFRARIENDRATEFSAALAQVHRIARLRLEAMAAESGEAAA